MWVTKLSWGLSNDLESFTIRANWLASAEHPLSYTPNMQIAFMALDALA
jgi:hypothetical protein